MYEKNVDRKKNSFRKRVQLYNLMIMIQRESPPEPCKSHDLVRKVSISP